MPDMPATHGNAMPLGTIMIASKKKPAILKNCMVEADLAKI